MATYSYDLRFYVFQAIRQDGMKNSEVRGYHSNISCNTISPIESRSKRKHMSYLKSNFKKSIELLFSVRNAVMLAS